MGQVVLSLPSDGTTIDASDVNTPFNTLVNEFNGNIDDNNIKTGANISGAKLNDASIPGKKFDSTTYGGWIAGVLPAVSSVAANGNRSYNVTFNSTVASYLTPGQRIRTTRTSAAPTQCTSLNGTTQYWVKTTPNKLTFTDDFVVSAWVKLSSYPATDVAVISRINGTQGWLLSVTTAGRVVLTGYNAGLTNYSQVISYQSIPINKWVHITAQLDMSSFTATTTTSYIMLDGVDIPASVARGGTNPTALVQAGNLEIGSGNATSFFPGKIAQVAIYNAKVTQANILATISQGLTGSETSLASAYSFNNSIADLNTSTPNDLTANGSAVATNADSPFGGQADGTISSTLDYGIVTKVSTTVATVQVPEGCTIPTTGGVTSVDMSPWKAPYNMPVDSGKWFVENLYLANVASATLSANTWKAITGATTNFPIGAWELGIEGCMYESSGGAVALDIFIGIGTTTDAQPDYRLESGFYPSVSGTAFKFALNRYAGVNLSSATTYYLNVKASTVSTTTIGIDASSGAFAIRAKNAYL